MLEKQGLVKLVEECGELIQVAAKKMTRMDSDVHWDGNGSLKKRIEDECGDVVAAIAMVIETLDLNEDRICERADRKIELFEKWLEESADEEPVTVEAQG